VTATVSSRAVTNEPQPQNARPYPRTRIGVEGPLSLRSIGPFTPHTSQQLNTNLLAYFYSPPVDWFCSALDNSPFGSAEARVCPFFWMKMCNFAQSGEFSPNTIKVPRQVQGAADDFFQGKYP
jgi:hypothetical protein